MKVQLTDLLANYKSIETEANDAVKAVITKANFILGEEVRLFETKFAEFVKVKHAIGVANGTDALRIALLAAGIKPGDEVITTPFTFIATTEAIIDCKAIPVFADIDPETYNIDPDKIKSKITSKTKAILPVHLYGQPCKMDEIRSIAKASNLMVIEDCAQSFTAAYTSSDGSVLQTGSMGICGCFSFFPAKNLGCFGDGGMITTNDDSVAEKIKMLRNHGCKVKYMHDIHGFNSRLDTIQAAVLLVKIKYIEKWTKMRNLVADKYSKLIGNYVKTPKTAPNTYHSFNYYNVRTSSKDIRDKLQKYLDEKTISNQIYYPVSLHLQQCYKHLGYKKGDFPAAEAVQDTALALPMYPELSDEQIGYIADNIKGFFAK